MCSKDQEEEWMNCGSLVSQSPSSPYCNTIRRNRDRLNEVHVDETNIDAAV